MFYDQAADGILGMGMSHGLSIKNQKPIYEALYDANLIDSKMFTICLGKNGGFFQIGGYNSESFLEPIVWKGFHYPSTNYKFTIQKTWVHNHEINGSEYWNVGFLDTGTTFSYLPGDLWDSLILHFDYFCEESKKNHTKGKYCPGERFLYKNGGELLICFKYDGVMDKKEFFMGYPIIRFQVAKGKFFNWYPSEYLYLEKDGAKYCVAADKNIGSREVLFGSTLMRQNAFIFDTDSYNIGFARTKCNDEPSMIISEQDYIDFGNTYGLNGTDIC